MNTVKELAKYLNDEKIESTSMDWTESIPEDMWLEVFVPLDYTTVDSGLDVDTRRWYETSVTVIKVLDGFLGIRNVTNIFSESMSVSDASVTMEFYVMEEVPSISYKVVRE